MFNFLRKLRQKEFKGRYLKYALGEIVLVVIGILIALQINNWNEHVKEQKNIKVALQKLIEDLAIDTISFNAHSKYTQRSINFGKEVMASLDTITNTSNVQEFVLKLQSTGRINFPKITKNTFLDLQNSGHLKSIGNDKLVAQLKEYYLDDFDFWKVNYVNRTSEGLLPVVTKILPFYIQEQILNFERQNGMSLRLDNWYYNDFKMVFKPNDKQRILNMIKHDEELLFHLKNATRAHMLQYSYNTNIITNAKALINSIELQLDMYD